MLRNVLLMILAAVIVFAIGISYAADEVPAVDLVVDSFTYTGEKAAVHYTDGTEKVFSAEVMGIREYDVFCKNLSLGAGEPKIVLPIRYLVVRTRSSSGQVVDTKVEGVVPDDTIQEVKAETIISE